MLGVTGLALIFTPISMFVIQGLAERRAATRTPGATPTVTVEHAAASGEQRAAAGD
jgi:hypothetical protein